MGRDQTAELVALDRQLAELAAAVALRPAIRPEVAEQGRALAAQYQSILDGLSADVRADLPFRTGDALLDARFIAGSDDVVTLRTAHVIRHAPRS